MSEEIKELRERVETLEREAQTMLGMQASLTMLLGAVIMTHPRYADWQLVATMTSELMLGHTPLPPRSQEAARTHGLQLQQLGEVKPGTPQMAIAALLEKAAQKR